MAQRVRQRDVAERSGVSISTVSRVLNGVPGISADVRDHVLSVAQKLGYRGGLADLDRADGARPLAAVIQPSAPMTAAPRRETVIVASTLDNLSAQAGQFHTDILAGVEDACRRAGIEPQCIAIEPTGAASGAIAEADAVLVLSVDDHGAIEHARRNGTAIGVINAEIDAAFADVTLPDNEGGAVAATRHLLDLGHERIVFLQHSERSTIARRRIGFERAVGERLGAAHPTPWRLVDFPVSVDAVIRILAELQAAAPFTAVMCSNDVTAMAALPAVAALGHRVPEDVAVVGFDDLPMAAMAKPALTTVRIDRQRLGQLAVQRLLMRLDEGAEAASVTTLLRPSLIVRASSGGPRGDVD